MRTTLTLDEDVAVQVERLRRERDLSLKDVVNEALRLGLRDMRQPVKKRKRFRTRSSKMGPPLVDIANVAEALALLEGDDFK